jgi:hypothetical protein
MAETLRRPPGRYDEPRYPAWLLPAMGGVLAAVLVSLLLLSWVSTSGRRTPSTLKGFDVVSDEAVDVRFEVRKSDGDSVVCALRALDSKGAVVGTEDVVVPVGQHEVEHRLATTARAYAAQVVGCSGPTPAP